MLIVCCCCALVGGDMVFCSFLDFAREENAQVIQPFGVAFTYGRAEYLASPVHNRFSKRAAKIGLLEPRELNWLDDMNKLFGAAEARAVVLALTAACVIVVEIGELFANLIGRVIARLDFVLLVEYLDRQIA